MPSPLFAGSATYPITLPPVTGFPSVSLTYPFITTSAINGAIGVRVRSARTSSSATETTDVLFRKYDPFAARTMNSNPPYTVMLKFPFRSVQRPPEGSLDRPERELQHH